MARLGDYIEQIRGVSYKPEDICSSTDNGAVAILRANNIQDDGLKFDDLVYIKESKISDKQYIQKGDIVVCASSGSKNLVGKAAIASENFPVAFGAFCKVVRPKKLIPSYIGYFFQSPKYRSTISELSGGANINNIRNEHIDELDIVIVSEEEQESIVNQLDDLSNLISLRKQQLSKFDELVKSRFVELFGDPISNPMGWTTGDMKDICIKITDGEHGSVARVDSGNVFLNAKHIKKDGTIDWDTVTYTSDEVHNKIYSRCNPEPGDILLTTTGTIGNVAIVPNISPFSMDRGITLLKINRSKVSNVFVAVLLRFDCIQKVMNANVHASAIGHLFLNKVMRIPVIVPPIELQNQFAAFVEQTDKSKLAIQQSLEKLETLKKALMQKYFG